MGSETWIYVLARTGIRAFLCHVSCVSPSKRTILSSALEALMSQPALRETTVERIYRESTGHKMPLAIKKILLPKRPRAQRRARPHP